MALLKRNTAAALEAAQQDLAAVEQTIADLRGERETLLPDGNVSEIEHLDQKIVDHERQTQVYRDKIPVLQARLATEQAEQKRRLRQQAIAKAEEILPQRMGAIYALARWAKDGVALVEKLEQISRLKDWPDGLERPYATDVDNARILRAISAALSGFGNPDWNPVERIADAVEIEKEHHIAAIDDLRLAPASKEDIAA